jgi:hypothetical protein
MGLAIVTFFALCLLFFLAVRFYNVEVRSATGKEKWGLVKTLALSLCLAGGALATLYLMVVNF